MEQRWCSGERPRVFGKGGPFHCHPAMLRQVEVPRPSLGHGSVYATRPTRRERSTGEIVHK